MVLLGDWAKDGIRLNNLDLGGQELIGIIRGHARGVLADGGGWHLAIDIHGHCGFVYRREAPGDDDGGRHTAEDEAENLPAVAAEDPEIVGEGDGRLIGRFGIVAGPSGLDGLVGGWKVSWFRHIVGRGRYSARTSQRRTTMAAAPRPVPTNKTFSRAPRVMRRPLLSGTYRMSLARRGVSGALRSMILLRGMGISFLLPLPSRRE